MQEKAPTVVRSGPVENVARHFVSQAAKVDANLVSATGADLHFCERELLIALHDPPMSDGVATGVAVWVADGGHSDGLPGVAADGAVDCAFVALHDVFH